MDYARFLAGQKSELTPRLAIIEICKELRMSYTEYMSQPKWWLEDMFMAIMESRKEEAHKAKP